MPTRTDQILDLVDVKIDRAEDAKKTCQEQISILNASKEPHKGCIDALDNLLFDETNAINDSIDDVGAKYYAKVTAGCRSDLIWRVVSHDPDASPAATYDLECVRVQSGAYSRESTTGIGTVFAYVEPDGTSGISSVGHNNDALPFDDLPPLICSVGFATDYYHGLKIFDEPYVHAVSDTYVTSGVGTCGIGQTLVYLMSPLPTGMDRDYPVGFSTGMMIQASELGIFAGSSNAASIIGIGTTTLNMERIPGISTISSLVNYFLIDSSTIGIASAPMPDGGYNTFTISKDPSGIDITDWSVDFEKDGTYTPQTLRMMTSDLIGTGTSIAYDNSGEPNISRTWDPFMLGFPDPDDIDVNVTRPLVGAGRSHYRVGFGSFPKNGGSAATLGTKITVALAAVANGSLYGDITTSCSTQQTALVAAIAERDALETALSNSMSNFNARLALSNEIRTQKNGIDLEIWAYRGQIGQANSDMDKEKLFKGVINDTEFLDEIN